MYSSISVFICKVYSSVTITERIDGVFLVYLPNYYFFIGNLKDVVKKKAYFVTRNACVQLEFSINKQRMLKRYVKERSLVIQGILYEPVSKEGCMLKVDFRKKMLSYAFLAKAAEAKTKERQTAGEKRRRKRQKNNKKVKDVSAEKKVALESTSKVTNAYDTRLYKLKVKL